MPKPEKIKEKILEHLRELLSFFPPNRLQKIKRISIRIEDKDGYAEVSFPIK